ncbi:hypothetical protein BGW41_001007 [Actinomortierella wolfii]|nr:hypothetical protein BGW41_001007 [Actinomortierella wolfii]
MQNIPGLSFFDGLTKSRHPINRHSPNSGSSGPGSPPIGTPLKDAAPFSRLRTAKSTSTLKDPLSRGTITGYEYSDDEDDKNTSGNTPTGSLGGNNPSSTASSSSTSTFATTSSLPATSFSRRAATLSAGNASTNTSSTPRASILPRNIESIFTDPKSSSVKNASTPSPVRSTTMPVRRTSEASQKGNMMPRILQEPTAEDIQKLGKGTLGYAMLDKIQEHPIELADIIRLLVAKKAMLVLPTIQLNAETTLDRPLFEDHAIIVESSQPESLFVTMSGIQGVLQPSDIAILGLASGQDFTSRVSDAMGPLKRSFFDTLTKSNNVSSSLNRCQDLKIENSSKGPIIISIDAVGSIHAILTNARLLRPETPSSSTPTAPAASSTPTLPMARSRRSNSRSSSISSVGNQERPVLFAALRRSTNSSTSSALLSLKDDKDSVVPRTPKIATDLPLEWDSMVQDLENFITKIKRHPHQDMDKYAHEFQRKYDDVRRRFEVYASQTGLHQRWNDNDYDEMQQWVEALLCHELYHIVDSLHDEQLQAKIAALNFLDLTLEHLGFVLDSPEDVEHIAQVVRDGGKELQKLAQFKSPMDKLHVLMSSHRVVVDTLNRDPAVQNKIKEEQEKEEKQKSLETDVEGRDKSTPPPDSATPASDTPSATATTNNKRTSIPRIMMDEGFQDRRASVEGVKSPRIPMDGDENDTSNLSAFKLGTVAETKDVVPEPAPAPLTDTLKEDASVTSNASPKQDKTNVGVTEEPNDETKASSSTTTAAVKDDKAEAETTLHVEKRSEDSQTTPDTSAVETEETQAQNTKAPSVTGGNNADTTSISGKHYSADVLLPLLIFSVVKSNPPSLIANLRFIQRFRVQDQLSGEAAYCLTNMMAVVSFLEELDPQALGLSSHVQVMSDMSDLRMQPQAPLHLRTGSSTPSPLVQLQEGIDQTRALGQKVGQELVDAAEEGLKVISDVVQDGYSRFFGRFLTATDGLTAPRSMPRREALRTENMNPSTSTSNPTSSLPETDHAKTAAVKLASTPSDLISRAAPVTGGVSGVSGNDILVEKSSAYESAMEHAARSRIMDLLATSNGPMITYMACTNAGDLRLRDVQALLDDYQRLGRLVDEMKRLFPSNQ